MFMNLGYNSLGVADVNEADSKNEHHISLYRKLLNEVPGITERNKKWEVLEVGCGRGGGCYVLKNYYNMITITGIDLSSANIVLAKKILPELHFMVDSATEFKFDKKYDLILNLESSHAYNSRKVFFENVNAHLKNNGIFAFGDVMAKTKVEEIEKWLVGSGFKIIKSETITTGIISSIEKNSAKQFPLQTKFKYLFPQRIHNFLVTIHSKLLARFKSGMALYRIYILVKTANN